MICIGSDKKRLIYLLLIIVFSSSVLAAENYKVFSGEDISVCPGTTALITDKVQNTINNPITLTIASSGSASGFSTIIPNGLVLQANSMKTIYSYISPRTTTQTGIYNLALNIDNNGNTEKIEHKINVKNCYDFEIKALRDFENVCPSENTQVRFELKNLGNYDETYTIEAEGAIKDWVSLSSDFISLKKDESKIITAFITAQSNAEGQYFFTLVVKSQTTDTVKVAESSIIVNPCYTFNVQTDETLINMCERSLEEIDLKILTEKGALQGLTSYNVNVKKCYDVALDIEKDSDIICNSLSNDYSINIKNIGEVDSEYILSIEGPSWATIKNQRIDLEKEEEESIDLEINPSSEVESKEYDIIVKAQAFDSSKVSAEDKIKINVVSTEQCYQPSVQAQKDTIIVNYDSSATISIIIGNKGKNDATYTLSVTGTASAFSQLNPASLTVSSGKSEVVYLYIAPSSQTQNGNYEATISARLEDSTILATDSVKITVTESKYTEETPQETQKEGFFRRTWNKITGLFTKEKEIEEQINKLTNETDIINNTITTNETTIANETKNKEIIEVNNNETENVNETITEVKKPSLIRKKEEPKKKPVKRKSKPKEDKEKYY